MPAQMAGFGWMRAPGEIWVVLNYAGKFDSAYMKEAEANEFVEAAGHGFHAVAVTLRYTPDKDNERELRSRLAGGRARTPTSVDHDPGPSIVEEMNHHA